MLEQSNAILASRTVHFRYASEADASWILDLRRAPSKSGMLSATPDDVGAQRQWLAEYQKRHAAGLEHYFIVCIGDGTRVGTVRIHDVSSSSCWWGSWVISPESPIGTPLESYAMTNLFMFEVLKVREAGFRVRQANLPVLRFHDAMGSRRVSESDGEIVYSADAAWYTEFRRKHDAHFSLIKRTKEFGP